MFEVEEYKRLDHLNRKGKEKDSVSKIRDFQIEEVGIGAGDGDHGVSPRLEEEESKFGKLLFDCDRIRKCTTWMA